MIISASRRTDIPAFYGKWMINRLTEGFAMVRNPFNFHMVSKIKLSPDIVECIVFWSKNPAPFIKYLDIIDNSGYKYYFHFTLTPYDKKIENGLPDKSELLATFKKLSKKIGREKIIWRYDPILIADGIDCGYHIKNFEHIAGELAGYTDKCVISFIDMYKTIQSKISGSEIRKLNNHEINAIAAAFSQISLKYGIQILTCAEEVDLSAYNIAHSKCIDAELISRITGHELKIPHDKHQRKFCGCAESVDIGSYGTCLHNCVYCYANGGKIPMHNKIRVHDENSPLIFGSITYADIITERKIKNNKTNIGNENFKFDI